MNSDDQKNLNESITMAYKKDYYKTNLNQTQPIIQSKTRYTMPLSNRTPIKMSKDEMKKMVVPPLRH